MRIDIYLRDLKFTGLFRGPLALTAKEIAGRIGGVAIGGLDEAVDEYSRGLAAAESSAETAKNESRRCASSDTPCRR
jgi:hypothetical protein